MLYLIGKQNKEKKVNQLNMGEEKITNPGTLAEGFISTSQVLDWLDKI